MAKTETNKQGQARNDREEASFNKAFKSRFPEKSKIGTSDGAMVMSKADKEYYAKHDARVDAHMREADRKGADVTNLGWGSGDNFIHSKTTKGTLYTQDKKSGTGYVHKWDSEN